MRLRTAFVLVIVCSAVVAQSDPYLATVSGNKVRLRGGPADFHAVLDEMAKGTPVRVVGVEGDWKRVEVPGGFDVFVALGKKDRKYLDTSKAGEGIVLVDDLMIRGTASTDFPPIGRLNSGDRVVVLDTKNGWARLLSPSAARSWIHSKYVAKAEDQTATLAAFNSKHDANRQALLAAGAASRELLQREQHEREIREKVRAAFARYDAEQAKAWDERDVAGTRAALVAVRDGLPEGDGDRVRAAAMLKSLDDWEGAATALKDARKRFETAQREAEEANKNYGRSLRDLNKKMEADANKRTAPPPSRYRAQGHVQRVFPVDGLRRKPTWAVSSGNRPIFYLGGDRYDWSEYEGKLIGILRSEAPEKRFGLDARVLKVSRIEILDG